MAEKKMSVQELKMALAAAQEEEKAAARAEREERRRKERAEMEARVAEYREQETEASVGDYREWVGLNTGFNGGLEVTFYDVTTPQSSITLSSEAARELRDHLNRLLG